MNDVSKWDDSDRELFVYKNSNLFNQWHDSGLNIWEWIATNRVIIDQVAGRELWNR